MNHIIDQLKKYQAQHFEHASTVNAMIEVVQQQSTRRCKICRGWGHKIATCCTKKQLDNICKKFPQWKIVWGAIKGSAMKKRARACMRLVEKQLKAKQAKAILIDSDMSSSDEDEEDNDEDEDSLMSEGDLNYKKDEEAKADSKGQATGKQAQAAQKMPKANHHQSASKKNDLRDLIEKPAAGKPNSRSRSNTRLREGDKGEDSDETIIVSKGKKKKQIIEMP